ncbi:MAG: hypothetical protein DRQ61_04445 [Gammaproteobacteria bacterium]|nr:MAG: hypothetical protein DRQ56_04725 [Gammaproteobacteria bacterium]RLA23226.1 MAG: hypothetical protein DRQ61_04445 [Gammaproteobacteria bacterium]
MLSPARYDLSITTSRKRLFLVAVCLIATACATPVKPTLYPNSHLKRVGGAVAQQDIDECYASARNYGVKENKDGNTGKKAAKGAVIGGLSAGAWGLVTGNAGERALAGAAAGGATGAAVGAMDSKNIDPVFKSYVNKCLRDKGYEVIGWQ